MPEPIRRVLMIVNADTRDTSTHAATDSPDRVPRRADFVVIRQRLDADIIDWNDVANSRFARLVEKVFGTYVALAVVAFGRRRSTVAYWCDVENGAIVLAWLLKIARTRVPLVCMGVFPVKPIKILAWRVARVQTHLDVIQPLTTTQTDRLINVAGLGFEKVEPLPYAVDEQFWSCANATARKGPRPYVFAAGMQDRDYPTLIAASEGLDADILIAAGSLWSRSNDSLERAGELPANVTVELMDYVTLRDAYAGAAVVVAPTVESDFAPGITSILEAMSMARPVVATRAEGNGDYVTDRRRVLRNGPQRATGGGYGPRLASVEAQGPTGMYVAPGDVEKLHSVLELLLKDHELAEQLGNRGRRIVEEVHTVDAYAERIAKAVILACQRLALEQDRPW